MCCRVSIYVLVYTCVIVSSLFPLSPSFSLLFLSLYTYIPFYPFFSSQYRLSVCCVHVSALLHALVALTPDVHCSKSDESSDEEDLPAHQCCANRSLHTSEKLLHNLFLQQIFKNVNMAKYNIYGALNRSTHDLKP